MIDVKVKIRIESPKTLMLELIRLIVLLIE
jgi:hypothetical protein